jgi:hypothetical protein
MAVSSAVGVQQLTHACLLFPVPISGAWNDNSPDTNGGIVKSDWAQIDWQKIAFLHRLGLTPWYA